MFVNVYDSDMGIDRSNKLKLHYISQKPLGPWGTAIQQIATLIKKQPSTIIGALVRISVLKQNS